MQSSFCLFAIAVNVLGCEAAGAESESVDDDDETLLLRLLGSCGRVVYVLSLITGNNTFVLTQHSSLLVYLTARFITFGLFAYICTGITMNTQ